MNVNMNLVIGFVAFLCYYALLPLPLPLPLPFPFPLPVDAAFTDPDRDPDPDPDPDNDPANSTLPLNSTTSIYYRKYLECNNNTQGSGIFIHNSMCYPSRNLNMTGAGPFTLKVAYAQSDIMYKYLRLAYTYTNAPSLINPNLTNLAQLSIDTWNTIHQMKNDGYNVIIFTLPHLYIYPRQLGAPRGVQWTMKDYKMVYITHQAPLILAVSTKSRFFSIADLIQNQRVTFTGPPLWYGYHYHIYKFTEQIKKRYPLFNLTYHPFSLTADAIGAVIRDQTGMTATIASMPDLLAYPAQLRGIAITGLYSMPEFPDCETFADQGYDMTDGYFQGVGVPASTPDDIVRKVSSMYDLIHRDVGMINSLRALGLVPMFLTANRTQSFLAKYQSEIEQVLNPALVMPVKSSQDKTFVAWIVGIVVGCIVFMLFIACCARKVHIIYTRREHELRKMKESAEKANAMKGDFLANMSHEIRTPLNGVIGNAHLLRQTKLYAEQEEYVSQIESSGTHLLTVINDILEFSKLESGQIELEDRAFDIRACIEQAIQLSFRAGVDDRLEVLYFVDQRIPQYISGDVTRLRQILVNLLGNAFKFSRADIPGEVTVHLTILEEIAHEIPSPSPQPISHRGMKKRYRTHGTSNITTPATHQRRWSGRLSANDIPAIAAIKAILRPTQQSQSDVMIELPETTTTSTSTSTATTVSTTYTGTSTATSTPNRHTSPSIRFRRLAEGPSRDSAHRMIDSSIENESFIQEQKHIPSPTPTPTPTPTRRFVLQMEVRDQGIGISPDRQERLFKAFSQLDASVTREYGGTGLGLSISSRLCHLMGGEMWVESELGRGSSFFFTLRTRSCVPDKEPATNPYIFPSSRWVLIVHSAKSFHSAATSILNRWGLYTVCTTSPYQALNWIKGETIPQSAIVFNSIPSTSTSTSTSSSSPSSASASTSPRGVTPPHHVNLAVFDFLFSSVEGEGASPIIRDAVTLASCVRQYVDATTLPLILLRPAGTTMSHSHPHPHLHHSSNYSPASNITDDMSPPTSIGTVPSVVRSTSDPLSSSSHELSSEANLQHPPSTRISSTTRTHTHPMHTHVKQPATDINTLFQARFRKPIVWQLFRETLWSIMQQTDAQNPSSTPLLTSTSKASLTDSLPSTTVIASSSSTSTSTSTSISHPISTSASSTPISSSARLFPPTRTPTPSSGSGSAHSTPSISGRTLNHMMMIPDIIPDAQLATHIPLRVLIVDDDITNRKLLRRFLFSLGYQCTTPSALDTIASSSTPAPAPTSSVTSSETSTETPTTPSTSTKTVATAPTSAPASSTSNIQAAHHDAASPDTTQLRIASSTSTSYVDVDADAASKHTAPTKKAMIRKRATTSTAVNHSRPTLAYVDSLAVDEAVNGLEAFNKAKEQHYDVIFMDMQMPKCSGIQATQMIRTWYVQQKIRPYGPWIIALTANALDQHRQECLAAGMDGYISKPFSLTLLKSNLIDAGHYIYKRLVSTSNLNSLISAIDKKPIVVPAPDPAVICISAPTPARRLTPPNPPPHLIRVHSSVPQSTPMPTRRLLPETHAPLDLDNPAIITPNHHHHHHHLITPSSSSPQQEVEPLLDTRNQSRKKDSTITSTSTCTSTPIIIITPQTTTSDSSTRSLLQEHEMNDENDSDLTSPQQSVKISWHTDTDEDLH